MKNFDPRQGFHSLYGYFAARFAAAIKTILVKYPYLSLKWVRRLFMFLLIPAALLFLEGIWIYIQYHGKVTITIGDWIIQIGLIILLSAAWVFFCARWIVRPLMTRLQSVEQLIAQLNRVDLSEGEFFEIFAVWEKANEEMGTLPGSLKKIFQNFLMREEFLIQKIEDLEPRLLTETPSIKGEDVKEAQYMIDPFFARDLEDRMHKLKNRQSLKGSTDKG